MSRVYGRRLQRPGYSAKRTKLIAARIKKGLSQEAFAEAMGVTKVTISHWENAQKTPYPFYKQKLCALLDEDDPEELLRIEYIKIEAATGEETNQEQPEAVQRADEPALACVAREDEPASSKEVHIAMTEFDKQLSVLKQIEHLLKEQQDIQGQEIKALLHHLVTLNEKLDQLVSLLSASSFRVNGWQGRSLTLLPLHPEVNHASLPSNMESGRNTSSHSD